MRSQNYIIYIFVLLQTAIAHSEHTILVMLKLCFLCSPMTVKRPNEFGDGRLVSGRDPLGGGNEQDPHL